MRTLSISSRFNGPPKSGNGGYSAGIIGQHIDGPAEVILRSPPPLDKALQLSQSEDQFELYDGDTLVAQARAHQFEVDLPEAVSFEYATECAERYIGYDDHHFSTCFVCGPDRSVCDGLRIFTGATTEKDIVAAPWTPCDDMFDADGLLEEPFYWSAMDCPSYFAIVGQQMKVLLLGKMSCHIENPITKGENIVVMAWKEKVDGRKHYSGTVLYGEDGTVKSYSKNVWISLSEEQIARLGS